MAEKDIKNENMNTQEEKIRIVTLYSFFDYSVFVKDYSGKVKEENICAIICLETVIILCKKIFKAE